MENKNKPNENKNKSKMRIYKNQTQIQDFVEPEWMKIIESLLEQKQQPMAKNHNIMVKNG